MDLELKQQLDRMEKFLLEHIVTKEELLENNIRLEEKLATKQNVESLKNSVDSFANSVKNWEQEWLIAKDQMSRMQGWMRSASARLGVEFKL